MAKHILFNKYFWTLLHFITIQDYSPGPILCTVAYGKLISVHVLAAIALCVVVPARAAEVMVHYRAGALQ
jgi:hypothetical protein